MSEQTVVHLLRHGEVFNPDKILYGRLPGFRLSDAGVEMAATAAKWFVGRDVTHLVSSPLERAQQTAAPIAEVLSLPVAIDERLIEAGNMFSIFFVPDGRQVRNYDDARTQDVAAYTAFFHALLARGVYLPPSAFEAWFVNAALSGEALDRVLAALPAAARAAAEVGA